MSRLSSKFDRSSSEINARNYIEQLKQFDNFEYMLSYIKNGLERMTKAMAKSNSKSASSPKNTTAGAGMGDAPHQSVELEPTFKETLKYLFNVLENVTSVEELRDVINCRNLFENTRDLFTDQLDT